MTAAVKKRFQKETFPKFRSVGKDFTRDLKFYRQNFVISLRTFISIDFFHAFSNFDSLNSTYVFCIPIKITIFRTWKSLWRKQIKSFKVRPMSINSFIFQFFPQLKMLSQSSFNRLNDLKSHPRINNEMNHGKFLFVLFYSWNLIQISMLQFRTN